MTPHGFSHRSIHTPWLLIAAYISTDSICPPQVMEREYICEHEYFASHREGPSTCVLCRITFLTLECFIQYTVCTYSSIHAMAGQTLHDFCFRQSVGACLMVKRDSTGCDAICRCCLRKYYINIRIARHTRVQVGGNVSFVFNIHFSRPSGQFFFFFSWTLSVNNTCTDVSMLETREALYVGKTEISDVMI